MKIKILDNKPGWYLGKVSLLDYIEALSVDNFNYEIQRGIVANPFLDTILNAVNTNTPLAPISLVTKNVGAVCDTVDIKQFNILDGLQRTFRLWIYYHLSKLAIENHCGDYKIITKEFRHTCDNYSTAVSPRQVRSLFKKESEINVWNLKDNYANFDLYLYLWSGLSVDQEIKQMLILNAGQKQMNLNHQFELMYMRLFTENEFSDDRIKIIRAKDGMPKERKVGEYLLSSVIIGVQSLVNMKPMRLSRDIFYKDYDSQSNISLSAVEDVFTIEFIQRFLDLLLQLDCKVSSCQVLSDWFVKDTTIAGIMAGIGIYINSLSCAPSEILDRMKASVAKIKNADDFALLQYEDAYQKLSSAKLNIGMVVRKAIMFYTEALLKEKQMSWVDAFNMAITKNMNYEKG